MIAANMGAPTARASLEPDRRLAEYEMLLEVGIKLSSSLDPTTVLEQALQDAEQFCQAETSSIWELDEDRQDLFFRVVRGRAAGVGHQNGARVEGAMARYACLTAVAGTA